MKPKGRPPVLPRLEDLERAVLELAERVHKLEALMAHETAKPYEAQFTQWPANGRP
jgi:hypothetical protein